MDPAAAKPEGSQPPWSDYEIATILSVRLELADAFPSNCSFVWEEMARRVKRLCAVDRSPRACEVKFRTLLKGYETGEDFGGKFFDKLHEVAVKLGKPQFHQYHSTESDDSDEDSAEADSAETAATFKGKGILAKRKRSEKDSVLSRVLEEFASQTSAWRKREAAWIKREAAWLARERELLALLARERDASASREAAMGAALLSLTGNQPPAVPAHLGIPVLGELAGGFQTQAQAGFVNYDYGREQVLQASVHAVPAHLGTSAPALLGEVAGLLPTSEQTHVAQEAE